MQPIVNRLEEQYTNRIHFVQLNATTDGAESYDVLGLRGHPAYLIFSADGEEIFRALGTQAFDFLEQILDDAVQ